MKKNIMVVTGSRSDYGLLRPVIRRIDSSAKLRSVLVVTGMHLLKKFGDSAAEIRRDGIKIANTVKMFHESSIKPLDNAKSFAEGVSGFAKIIAKWRPDIMLVLGDRLEIFAAVVAAAIMGVPIAHIHGGDTSECGQIDDSIRHSISRFAQIHFAATRKSADRLKKMGEKSSRIHNVGSPFIDSIRNQKLIGKRELCAKFGFDANLPIMICVQHSVIPEKKQARDQMRQTMLAIKELRMQTVVMYPNNDPGSEGVIAVVNSFANLPYVRIVKNLPHSIFVSLMNAAEVMIGNSSAGLLETPCFKLPNVSIGTRQLGREHSNNVLFVDYKASAIIRAVKFVLSDENFRRKLQKCRSPYGRGDTARRIVKILEAVKIDDEFMRKTITY